MFLSINCLADYFVNIDGVTRNVTTKKETLCAEEHLSEPTNQCTTFRCTIKADNVPYRNEAFNLSGNHSIYSLRFRQNTIADMYCGVSEKKGEKLPDKIVKICVQRKGLKSNTRSLTMNCVFKNEGKK
jgi:hypothetical protein